jgi:hypothetical protein
MWSRGPIRFLVLALFPGSLGVLAPSRVAGAVDVSAPAPTGAPIETGRLRPSAAARVCSLREAICVHGDIPPRVLLGVLASAERAWEVETEALALPAPDADLETGAYDLYVVHGIAEGAVTVLGSRDPRARFDRASAYTLFDASLALGDSCSRDTAIAASVARASLFRVAPATDEGSARAEAAYFARLAVPCAIARLDGIDTFQRSPERAFFDPFEASDSAADAEFSRGASLFYWWLDWSFSPSPGGIVRALWALSPTATPFGAERWNDEPDTLDVLRESFKDVITSGSRVEDILTEFGTTRALLGPRDNGVELPEARPLGAALSPRIDWTIDWPTTPRRLACPAGLAPTGSEYVLIHHAGAPAGSRLRVEAEWEQHAAIHWTVVKLDRSGRELGRIPVTAPPRATEAQATIVDLDATDALLVVATNVGDPYVQLDPDDERFEPHNWLVTLAAQ